MIRKVVLSFLGLAFVIGAILLSQNLIANKNRPKPVPPKVEKIVFVETAKNTSIPIVISASGNTLAKRRIELYSEVQGVFKPTGKLFKTGQKYEKGQPILKIDNAEHYALVQSAKSNLYNSIAAIMPDLQLDFPEVFKKWQRYISKFDMNSSTPVLPKMTSDKENYFITGRGIVSTYYNVKNLEQRLSKYTISAPFTGILTESLATEGSLVRNGQKLGEFIDTSAYEIEVAVSKSYAPFLSVGKVVNLKNLDGSAFYVGKVVRMDGSIDLTTQTITAYIEVVHPDLKEGVYLEAELEAKDEPNAIEIDRNLLSDNNTIFVVRDSILDIVSVNPVYFSDKKVVITSVEDGTIIVAKPVPGAYAGMLVKPYTNNNKE